MLNVFCHTVEQILSKSYAHFSIFSPVFLRYKIEIQALAATQ